MSDAFKRQSDSGTVNGTFGKKPETLMAASTHSLQERDRQRVNGKEREMVEYLSDGIDMDMDMVNV